MLEILFAVLSASSVNVGFIRSAGNSLTSILSINLDHGFSLVALGNLTVSVDHNFTFDNTFLGNTGVSSSDFVLLTDDFSAFTVYEMVSGSAWLVNTGLLLEIEVLGDLTCRNTVSSFELVTQFARGHLANLSVPSSVRSTSVNTSSSNRFHVRRTGLLNALSVLLSVSFLARKLETSSSN